MHHNFNFKDVLAISTRPSWAIEDVLPPGASSITACRFMPENLARTAGPVPHRARRPRSSTRSAATNIWPCSASSRNSSCRSSSIMPAPQLSGDDDRVRALLQFAGEEAKHIHLFKQFHRLFTESFETECAVIGPPEAVAAEVLRHDPLAVALVILHIEWMTQLHYLDSVKDDGDLDPLFKSLLRHHWMEEAQHAKLDTLMVEALAEGRDEAGIDRAIDEYLEIGGFLDNGFKAQAGLNLDAFERATGRKLGEAERAELEAQQHQALRWTYLGSGMTHPNFKATLEGMSLRARDRIAEVAPLFS